jgi:hypothetical protein
MASIFDVARRHDRNMATYRSTEMHGLVTSYDPKNHLAKVNFQPGGYESGWLEIHTSHIGSTYGEATGLQVGSGQGSGQDQGDQVVVSFQEDDAAAGKITGRVHSTQDKPLQVQSGEWARWAVFKQDSDAGQDSAQSGQSGNTGQKIFMKNDGGLYQEDGNGASHFMDGRGSVIHNATKTHTTQVISNRNSSPFDSLSGSQSSSSSPQTIHSTTHDKTNGVTTSAFNGSHTTTWGNSGITHTSSASVTSKAPNIPHQGNTSVTQNLTVGQGVTAQSYTTSSDIRLKSNIRPVQSVLDKIMALRAKLFDKKKVDYAEDGSETISSEPATPSIGFIAQDVREIFPEIVVGDESRGYLSVNESHLIPILVSAFQEYVTKTDREIAELRSRLH